MGRVNQTAYVRPARFLGETGFASLLVLVILTISVSLGLEIYLKANGENRIAHREAQGRQAIYAAEAGIEWAKSQLSLDPYWRGGTFVWEGGTAEVTAVPVSGGFNVISGAQAALARRKIQGYLQLKEGNWVMSKYEELHN